MSTEDIHIQRARRVVAFLSVVGAILAAIALKHYVLFVNGLTTGTSFCNINAHFNCDAVNASEWSTFFGIPVGAYGLFFYLVLLVGTLVSRVSGFLPPRTWASIAFLLSLIASLCSLTLLAISEFLIGSLCLVCFGLYLVNFAVSLVLWRTVWRGQVGEGISAGLRESASLIGETLALRRSERGWMLRIMCALVVGIGFACAQSPQWIVSVYSSIRGPQDPNVEAWRSAPLTTFKLQTSQGAFGDYSKGSPSAPIQIVEFADYECPACKMVSRVLKSALERYEGQYFFVFKNYPLDMSCNPTMTRELHHYACDAVRFARCAGEQGKFWEASDLLFLREADNGELTRESLVQEASKELALDGEAIGSCMDSKRYDTAILTDIQEGERVGIEGTPSIWINGRFVAAPSAQSFEAIFSSIVKHKGR